MTQRIEIGGLRVAQDLYNLVRDEIAPGTGIDPDDFWSAFGAIVRDLTPRNRELLAERDRLQAEDLAKLCPEGCLEKPVTRSGSGSRLVIARRVRQAGRVWVAYWTAWWWVEHKCIPTEKRKEPRYDPKRKRGSK